MNPSRVDRDRDRLEQPVPRDDRFPSTLRPQVLDAVRQVAPASEIGTVFSRSQGFRRPAALISAACVAAVVVAGVHGALTTSTTTPVLATADEPAGTTAMSSRRNEMLTPGRPDGSGYRPVTNDYANRV